RARAGNAQIAGDQNTTCRISGRCDMVAQTGSATKTIAKAVPARDPDEVLRRDVASFSGNRNESDRLMKRIRLPFLGWVGLKQFTHRRDEKDPRTVTVDQVD